MHRQFGDGIEDEIDQINDGDEGAEGEGHQSQGTGPKHDQKQCKKLAVAEVKEDLILLSNHGA